MQDLTLVMAQLDPLVGDIPGNAARAIEAVREARIEHGADIVVFPSFFIRLPAGRFAAAPLHGNPPAGSSCQMAEKLPVMCW